MNRVDGNKLRSAAPDLYQAAKQALRVLLQTECATSSPYREAIAALQRAIDQVEEGTNAGFITFVMTHRTAQEILSAVKAQENGKTLLTAIKKGTRRTKQRVYVKMAIDPSLLGFLRDILVDTWPRGSKRAFERIAGQIEAEVLTKSPLTFLADAGV